MVGDQLLRHKSHFAGNLRSSKQEEKKIVAFMTVSWTRFSGAQFFCGCRDPILSSQVCITEAARRGLVGTQAVHFSEGGLGAVV